MQITLELDAYTTIRSLTKTDWGHGININLLTATRFETLKESVYSHQQGILVWL
jgi:hypothetical protein